MRSSQRLSVALARAGGDWPHQDWPEPEDPHVARLVRVRPPYPRPYPGVDVTVLSCADPGAALPELLKALDGRSVPVIVVSPHRDTDVVVEAFRGGAGYLVEGDHCTHMLSSAVLAATVGHTYLSPAACAAVREAAGRQSAAGDAPERLRSLLSPRETQIIELLSTGLGAQEIGVRLSLSEKTVRNNLSNIYAKLGARGGTEAVLRWLGATGTTPVLHS
ncbi:LuxR C-terminal-related transcriptional regulator [Streptomyces sp. NPDC101175]|uniref:LuxR C-terminal-related transcriptional regulator n=1 Tax=Streptomyces sp. NPDC101175 TaxID=3366123 RepID=UPI00383601F4